MIDILPILITCSSTFMGLRYGTPFLHTPVLKYPQNVFHYISTIIINKTKNIKEYLKQENFVISQLLNPTQNINSF